MHVFTSALLGLALALFLAFPSMAKDHVTVASKPLVAASAASTSGTNFESQLADLESFLKVIANGLEFMGVAWGGPTMIMGFMHMAAGTKDAVKRVLLGGTGLTAGLATPACINWLMLSAHDVHGLT